MYKITKKISFFICAVVLSGSENISELHAEEQVIDRIVAIVGDTTISFRELMGAVDQYKRNLIHQEADIPDTKILIPRVLEELIAKKLQLLEAKKFGISIGENELDQTLTQIAKNNNLTLAEMKAKVERDGVNYAKFRESIREEMIVTQLKQREVINKVEVSETAVEEALAEVNAETKFRFSYLMVPLIEDEAARDELIQWFTALRAKILSEDNFHTLAAQAASKKNVVYKTTNAKTLTTLPKLLKRRVLNMEVGDITQIIRTKKALYLFHLDSKRGINMPKMMQEQYHVRHILLLPDAMNTNKQIQKKLLLMKRRIEDGASFEAFAKKYSQDPGSGFKGGDLGWIPTSGLAEEFAREVETAEIGKVIGPFSTSFGSHLLQVLGKREHDISSQQQRQAIIAQLRQQKSSSAIREWLLRLRENQHIDIRL